jgi:hypothetical protein
MRLSHTVLTRTKGALDCGSYAVRVKGWPLIDMAPDWRVSHPSAI